MYFLPRTNKIFSWLAHRNIRHLYIGSVVLLLAVFMSWFFFLYAYIDTKIERTQVALLTARNHQRDLGFLQTQHEKLKKQVAAAEKDFTTIAHAHTLHTHYSTLVPHVMTAAHASKLVLKQCSLESWVDNQWYVKIPMAIGAHGSINQIRQFFVALHKAEPLVQVNNFTINGDGQGGYNMQVALDFLAMKTK